MKFWTTLSPGMRVFLLALPLALLLPAHADVMISKGDGEARVRLMRTPCVSVVVLALIKEEHRPNFQASEARISRGTVPGCWILNAAGAVFLVFENGEMIEMPTAAFQLEPGA